LHFQVILTMDVLPVIKPNFDIASPLPPYSAAAEMLHEAISQLTHPTAEARIQAAQNIHQIAAMHPQQVAPLLARLLPALEAPETATRWMILRTVGLCAAYDPQAAMAALPHAEKFLHTECSSPLWNAALVYLGNVGATSAENANRVLPLLEQTLADLPQLTKATLESLARLLEAADIRTLIHIANLARRYTQHSKAGVRASAKKIVKRVSDYGLIPPNLVKRLAINHQIHIQSPPTRVYDALTCADEINQWLSATSFVDARPGGSIQIRWQSTDRHADEDAGRVIQATRPERFTFKWQPHRPDYTTTVEIDLHPVDDGTRLHLYESGYENSTDGSECMIERATRWNDALERLKAYVESAS
jgi:uncharacterized protein YndB with AHSA1/START domain